MKLKEKTFCIELTEAEVELLADVLGNEIREIKPAYEKEGGEVLCRRLSNCRTLRNDLGGLVGHIYYGD